VVNGRGEVSVVVRNALGQQVTETLPFYASPSMLAVGLTAYSVETGFVRRGFGWLSDDYQTPAASASWRYGASQWLTVEAHGEAVGSLAEGGAGVVFTLDNAAVISLSDAGSRSGGASGMQYAAQIQHADPYFNAGASIQRATAGYRDIAAVSGDPVPTLIMQAGAGVNCCAAGSLGFNFTKIESFDNNETIVTLSYNRQISGRAYFSADAFREFGHGGGSGVMVGLSLLFGQRGSIEIGPTVNDGQASGSVQVTEAAPELGDIGGQLLASDGQGQPAQGFGELSYYSPYGLFGIGIDKTGGTQTLRATANGALAFEDDKLFATNTIYDSFAVVDTNGVAGIHVQSENRPAGETGASGKLLLPDVRAFEVNHVSIDPNDVPIDDTLDSPSRAVRPQYGAGVVVKFPIAPSNGAILRLVDAAGTVLPLGSLARLAGSTQETSVGYDGEVFLHGLHSHNTLAVIRPDGTTCSTDFNFVPPAGRFPVLGLICLGPPQ
jgi:outer membrane usher protein